MELNYRTHPQPGVIDDNIAKMKEQAEAFRTEGYLVGILDEAIKHLERYRDTLRAAYITDSNKESHANRLPLNIHGNR